MLEMDKNQSTRVFGLDVLRFLAITFVVIGHGVQLIPSIPDLTVLSRSIDYLGVEFFFVLSGFLIGRIFLKEFDKSDNFSSLITFWKRRWWRTLPNYYLFLIINLVGFGYFKESFSFDWRYLFFLQNAITPNEGFFSVSWSLSVEEWFYLSVPFIYFLFVKLSGKFDESFWVMVGLIFVFSFVMRYVYIQASPVTWGDEIRRVVLLRMDSLIYGVAMAWIWMRRFVWIHKVRWSVVPFGIILIGASVVLRHNPALNETPWMLMVLFPLASLGTALIIPVLASWTVFEKKSAFIPSMITRISLWSYSLYLLHIPAMEVFKMFFSGQISENSFFQITLFFIWVFVSVFGSYVIYAGFEKPITKLRDIPFNRLIKNRFSVDQKHH